MIETTMRFTGDAHITGATFWRFFLPRLSGAERVLYLDVDTYPESEDIWRLFDLDMAGNAIAAVRDLEVACFDSTDKHNELRVSHCLNGKYLNAGVMVMDSRRYAEGQMEQRLVKQVVAFGGHDQTALNAILRGHWAELSPAYNATPIAYLAGITKRFPPVISHFQGKAKPWHGPLFYLDHPARGEIERFIPMTPWPSFIRDQVAARGWRPGIKVNYPKYTVPRSFIDAAEKHLRQTQFAA
jgi:lipopolysaccharide biosynthesis glycosyltransferase